MGNRGCSGKVNIEKHRSIADSKESCAQDFVVARKLFDVSPD